MKKTKKVFHPYILAHIDKTEKWLTEMSLDGWALIDMNGWHFEFIKSAPRKRMYVIFCTLKKGGSTKSIADYSDYWMIKKLYSKSRSKLKNDSQVFEVDIEKTDKDFYSFLTSRAKKLKKSFCLLSAFLLPFVLWFSVSGILLDQSNLWYLLFVAPFFLYCVISILILTKPKQYDIISHR